MQYEFEVTEEHIKQGIAGNSFHCPIALAILDKYPNRNVIVGGESATVEDVRFELGPNARDFVERFDCGLPVQPFTAYLYEEDYA